MQLELPTLQIRRAQRDDAARLARCYLASRKTLSAYAPLPHSDDDVFEWVESTLLTRHAVWVALESGAVVGLVATSLRDDAHWVDQLYVHPARLRRGIGATLLSLALASVQGPVRLYCFEPNKPARRFYERHGFSPLGYGDGTGNASQCPDVLYERPTAPR